MVASAPGATVLLRRQFLESEVHEVGCGLLDAEAVELRGDLAKRVSMSSSNGSSPTVHARFSSTRRRS